MARLCSRALEEGIEVEHARELIRALRLMPDAASAHSERWPWPVRIHTLGRFGILRDDKPIRFSRKAQGRPLAMLRALIALGGRDVREGAPADVLWPEAEGDAAHHSLEMTLHRLRSLLGHPEAVQLREGRLTLDPAFCWVDAWAFERLAGLSEQARATGRTDLAAGSARQALQLYRGAFLAGEFEYPGLVRLRERLRSKFVRTVAWLGQTAEDRGDLAAAIDTYRRGLEVDDLAEELYRRLMLCHRRRGEVGEALSAFERCRRILATTLGIEPSAETIAVHQDIARHA